MLGYKAPRLEGMKSTGPLRCLLVKLNCIQTRNNLNDAFEETMIAHLTWRNPLCIESIMTIYKHQEGIVEAHLCNNAEIIL